MRRKKRASKGVEPLSTVLRRDGAFAPAVVDHGYAVPLRDWERVVGTRIAGKTRPARLERGILTVITASSTWSNELSFLAPSILERLLKFGVAARELRFRVGTLAIPVGESRRPAKVAPRPVSLDVDLTRRISAVADEALREAIAEAARKSLGFARR